MSEAAEQTVDERGAPARIGDRVAGRYRIEGVLGQGGIGAVYLSTDEASGERVALKRMHRIHVEQKPVLATFFMREYHTLKQLAHPCIIDAHDFGLDEGGPYYTMELLSGRDLAELAPMPWQQACAVLRDVASALSLIHSRQLVHRDLSPRNVRFTSDGRAKLMDFGALASMGVCAELIGTPPFIPPEAFNRQALDARCDLYALGAIGYWLLTGRHAYPAKKVSMLRDVWRSRPTPIAALARDVPRALESLVFSLLNLDLLARPINANEVIERLTAIAALPLAEGFASARAYLTTPSLVGRNEELVRLRKQVLRATRGRGGSLLIEARSGAGRSRLLQAVELEGRLAGATVLHVSAVSAVPGTSGMLGALADGLLSTQPEAALAAAQVDKAMLGHVSAELHARLGHCELAPSIDRELPNMVQRALGEWLLRLCRKQSLVIAVDDAERGDDRALGLLVSLAQQARAQRLLLIAAVDTDARPAAPEALAALRRASSVATIRGLDAEQCAALVRSVFGDVPNLALVADFIYRLSEGNPRGCMELMQHMVDRGIVRYERGSFILPGSLREHELPQSLNATMDAVIAALPSRARELCLALAASELPLSLPEYALALGLEADAVAQAFAAVDALIDARVLVIERQGYRFRQHGYVEAAQRYADSQLWRTLHLRLSRIYELRQDLRRQAEHLLNAGEELAALSILVQHLENTKGGTGLAMAMQPLPVDAGARLDLVPDTSASVAMRKRLLQVCERHARPPRERFLIRGGLVFLANQHDMSLMRGYVEQQIAELRQHSGAVYWNETDPALAPRARIEACIARAQRVYEETPEAERVISPTDAIGSLVVNVGLAQAYARQGFEYPLLEELVELSARFSELSFGHRISHLSALHAFEVVGGRIERAAQVRAELLAYYDALLKSDRGVLRISLVGCVVMTQWEGIYRAMRGGREGAVWAQKLEDSDKWPWLGPNQPLTGHYSNHTALRRAWEIRRLVELYNGNAEAARACLEPIERLTMQHAFAAYGGGVAFYEAQAFAQSGDLMGLKQSVDTIATIVERQYPGWRPFLQVASGDYHRLRGELEQALSEYDAALLATGAGRHAAWIPAVAGRTEALIDLGRNEEALETARGAMAACERAELGSSAACELGRVLALAEASAGDHASGAARLEQLIASERALGLTGLPLGVLYEARTRIALMHDDDAAFERFAQVTAAQYKPGRNPALIAKYERLIQAAGTRRFLLSEEVVRAATPETADDPRDANTQLEQSSDGVNRSRRALGALIQQMHAQGALLYALNDDGIQLVTSISASPTQALENALNAYMQAELESSSEVTVTSFDQVADGSMQAAIFARVSPLVLTREEDGRTLVVGVIAVFDAKDNISAGEQALAKIAESMVDADEVVSVYVAS